MWNVAVFTDISISNSSVPRYQDTFDRGLLEISRFRNTLELSLTISIGIFSIEGWSEWYKIFIIVNFPIKIKLEYRTALSYCILLKFNVNSYKLLCYFCTRFVVSSLNNMNVYWYWINFYMAIFNKKNPIFYHQKR